LDRSISQLEIRCDTASKKALQALKAVKAAENQTQMFRKLRQTLRPFTGGSVSKVNVPSDLSVEVDKFLHGQSQPSQLALDSDSELQQTIRTKQFQDETSNQWETVIERKS
jgi:hypothetical protein